MSSTVSKDHITELILELYFVIVLKVECIQIFDQVVLSLYTNGPIYNY